MDLTLSSVVDGIQKVGFPIMVAAGALWVCWKLAIRQLDKMDAALAAKEAECKAERESFATRLDAKAEEHAIERQKHSEAHLAAITGLSESVKEVTAEVRDLRRDLAPPPRIRGG